MKKKTEKKPKADVVVKREADGEISTKGIKRTKHTEALAPFPEKAAKALGVEVPELIDDEVSIAIEATIRLEEVKLKDLKWYTKFRVGTQLPRGYHLYKVVLTLDEEPYNERIEDLENQVKGCLFEEDKSFRSQLDKQIANVRKELAERRKECERMEFNARTEELKWKDGDTIILMVVPDDVIEAFNRQKSRFSYYKIVLEAL